MGRTLGYARVSAADQNPERQEKALTDAGADLLFIDKLSGKDRNRPELDELLKRGVRPGDEVIVKSVDRLARSTVDLLAILEAVRDKGGHVRFLETEGLDINDKNGKFVLTILGAVAELEREMIRERQAEGIAIAKTKGVYKGRKPALTDDQADELTRRLEAGEPVAALAREYGVSRQTVYNVRDRANV